MPATKIKAEERSDSLRWYYDNRDSQRDKMRDAQTLKRRFIQWLKQQPCTDCGNNFPPECMDFDHLGSKVFNLNKAPLKIEAIQEEAMKCQVVCANCHRIRTVRRMR